MQVSSRLGTLVVSCVLLCALIAGCAAPAATSAPTATPTSPPPTPTVASPANEQAEPAPLSANVTTFASGLVYPRGLKFGPDGALYVAEAGRGGDTESMGNCEGYTSMFVPYHTGMTARVSRIGPDGVRSTVVDNLPSAQDKFGDVIGASDVVFVDQTLYAVSSGGGCSRGFADSPAGIVKMNSDGTSDMLADLSGFFTAHPAAAGNEEDYEPDGAANAVVAHDGKLYIVNANHGSLDEITLDGQIRRVLDISASQGHVTPASLTVHDGNFYVGALGKFPIRVGSVNVYQITPQGDISVAAKGLTAVLGLAFDEQGRLYVLEATHVDSDYPEPGAGRVVRVGDTGELEVIATGLSFPMGMTFGPDGALYVSNYGYGGDPAAGEVLRIDVSTRAMR